MKITPLTTPTALNEEQKKAAQDLAVRLWDNPGTIFLVEDFPGPFPHLDTLARYIGQHCIASLRVSLEMHGAGFKASTYWRE